MEILPDPTAFDWDDGNLHKNITKHDVSWQESEEMFSNKPLVLAHDLKHSNAKERRLFALGKTKANRRLFVVFTIRDNKIRVISARDMTRAEDNAYEDFT